ncbi:MAG TPA: metal-dependent transcriptional regulator [Limnochordia bacterium]
MRLTKQMADYLAAIYRLNVRDGRASTGEVARIVGVSAASATYMFKRLAALGLVEYEEYAGVALTPSGLKAALRLVRNHRLTERFLTDMLEIPWDRVDRLAHEMEHHVPDEVVDRFDAVLGYPETCPHGHPIPRKDGTVIERPARPLGSLDVEEEAEILQIDEDDPRILRYLGSCHLVPGRRVRVVAKNPLDQTMVVEVDGHRSIVGERISDCIGVARE